MKREIKNKQHKIVDGKVVSTHTVEEEMTIDDLKQKLQMIDRNMTQLKNNNKIIVNKYKELENERLDVEDLILQLGGENPGIENI